MSRFTTRARSLLVQMLLLSGLVHPATAGDYPPVSALKPNPELPDPLTMFDGRKVTSREEWVSDRRPELIRLFQHYMYGELPAPPKTVGRTIERVDANYFGGKATKKEVTIAFGPPGTPRIHLLVVTPNKPAGPKPVFLGINFCGNHTLLDDPTIALPRPGCPSIAPAAAIIRRPTPAAARKRTSGPSSRRSTGIRPGLLLLRRRRSRPQ